MGQDIVDKLRVFVSSTINECREERAVAKRAISSLNHEPILFEHIGARSTAPRELYLSRLESSHIFIGIYRNSYGWVAPGALISGIEDELHTAKRRGMPRLLYILEPASERTPRLTTLLEKHNEVTFWKFHHPDDLYQRIREDVEAEIARHFHEAETLEALVRTDAATALSGLVAIPKALLPRHQPANDLTDKLTTHPVVQVTGELGIGKTVFLAALAKERDFIFISASQLGNHEIATVIVNKLNALSGTKARYFADASLAYSALLESWHANDSFTLVIDDCADLEFVSALLKNVGGANAKKRLIYSTRNATSKFGHPLFPIPPLSIPEVAEFLAGHGREVPDTTYVQQIHDKSGGNPLYLLYFSQADDESVQSTLAEYELAAWRGLSSFTRELTSYLAIANQRLSLSDLVRLAGRRAEDVEQVSDALGEGYVFLTDFVNGYTLRHEHQRATILQQLSGSPSKFAYYSARVARLLAKRGDHVNAYFILRQADKTAADQLSRPALFEAQRRGDYKSQISILDNILEQPRSSFDPEDSIVLYLSKALALQYVGRISEVEVVFSEAEQIASKSNDPLLRLRVREAQTTFVATTCFTAESLDSLMKIEHEYLSLGDKWSAGRVTTELSVLFTKARRYPESSAAAERGLSIFSELGDDYGRSISELNLATALSATPGREAEGAALFEQLQNKQTKTGMQRERAWLCNYMVRTLRQKRELPEALKYGEEAIRIAEELGDVHLAATNRLNVGNVYRDMGNVDFALREYSASGELSRATGDKAGESSAARLSASIHRKQGNYGLALQFAQVAVGTVQGTFASSQLTDALEELGDCHFQSRDWVDASISYAKAAANADDSIEKSRLAVEAFETCVDKELGPEQYFMCVDVVYSSQSSLKRPFHEHLFAVIGEMIKSVHHEFAIRLFGLHFRTMFAGLPRPVARFLISRVLDELFAQASSVEDGAWRLLFPVMPLLVSTPEDDGALPDLVNLCDRIQDRVSRLHFKWINRNCAWVICINLRQPIILTVTCLDDRFDTFIAACLVSLFFRGFEDRIVEMIPLPEIPRREVDIFIGNLDSMPPDMRAYFPTTIDRCTVARPITSEKNAGDSPIFVLCSPDLAKQLHVGTGSSSAVQLLIGSVLSEVIFRLFKGEIDVEVLNPKLIAILRDTVS